MRYFVTKNSQKKFLVLSVEKVLLFRMPQRNNHARPLKIGLNRFYISLSKSASAEVFLYGYLTKLINLSGMAEFFQGYDVIANNVDKSSGQIKSSFSTKLTAHGNHKIQLTNTKQITIALWIKGGSGGFNVNDFYVKDSEGLVDSST